jgi:hypothetical protein
MSPVLGLKNEQVVLPMPGDTRATSPVAMSIV